MNSMHRIAAALSLALVAQFAFAANGELDPAFGTGGRVRITFPQGVTPNAAALQPDGKIVVVGTQRSNSAPLDGDFFIARLNADGSLDTSFDGDGMTTVDFNHGDDQARAVSITADNHILIVGSTFNTALFNDSAAVRLNSDGSLDASFGSGGKATYSFGRAANGFGTGSTALAALSDGRYIVGGGTDNTQGNGDFQLIRINVNGSLDTTFGTAGRTVVDFAQFGDDLVGVAVQSDGRIVAAGSSQKNGVHAISVARLLATGQPDTSVGDGHVSIQLENGGTASAITPTADGKLLIVGSIPTQGSFDDLGVVLRLLPDGTLDPTFGSGGRVVRSTEIDAVAADASGHVYFAGSVTNDTPVSTSTYGLVQALDSDGSALDNFGTPLDNLGAGVAIDSGHDEVASWFSTFSLLRLSDGRLIVLGRAGSDLLAARLLASGGSGGVISLLPSYTPTGNSNGHLTLSETKSGIDYLALRAGGVTGPVSVHYEASSSTAVAGTDYVATSGTLSWADGEITPKRLTVPLIDDLNYEAAATPITLTLSAPTGGASIGTSKVDVYVSSDEGQATVVSGFAEAYESNSSIKIPVTRTGDARLAVTVSYTVVGQAPLSGGGSAAIAGTDFTLPMSGTLTWDSYDVSRRYITVPLLDDNVQDGTKTLAVNLSNPSPGVVAQNAGASAFIYDDEGGSSGFFLDFLDRDVAVSESAGTVTLRVRRNDVYHNGTDTGATYDVATDFYPGTAKGGTDFGTPNPTQLSWAANEFTTKTITIPIVNDSLSEGPEDFSVNLIQGTTNYASTRVLIDDDDPPPPGGSHLSMRDATLSVAENVGSVPIVVERTGNPTFPVTVDLRVASLGAQQGVDFTAGTTTTLSWDGGDAAPKTLNVPIIADSVSETDELFSMTLENPTGGATIGAKTSTTVTIQGDLTGPGLGSAGFTTDTITVSEDAPYVDLPVARAAMGPGSQLTYSVHSGATADIGREVVFVNQPVPISFFDPMPVSTVQNIRVYLNGDRRDEPDENFVVDLRSTNGSLPGGTSAITVKLTSADAPPPTQLGFATTTISQAENQATMNLTVNRTGAGTGPVTVHYETVAGTATAGSDFTAVSGDLQWAAGDTSAKTIAVTLINDSAVESTESFTVKLSAPTGGATLASHTATISITDDDTASGGGGGGSGGSSSGGGGGGGGAFDWMSLVALSLILAFCIRRQSARC